MAAAQRFRRKIHSIKAWVKSKGREQEPTTPNAARLIGCGGRAAVAAAAVVGTHDVEILCLFFLVLYKIVCRQQDI